MIIYSYFFLISLSLIGYGYLVNDLLKINKTDYGNLGILGITFLAIISFGSSIFFSHNHTFNFIFFIIGILCFFYSFYKNKNSKKELFKFIIVFLLLLIFIAIAKNHDDFPYYHFPYSIFITEFSHPIGFGQLNNGFRSPSSIFFLNSMFYLPGINFYSFHFFPAYILGFTNLALIQVVLNKKIFDNNNFINFLSLISLIFINIFFYRLAEHGTDRSGMILTILSIIYLLILINNSLNDSNEIKSYLKLFVILIFFILTIKPFYFINLIFVTVLFFYKHIRLIFLKQFFTKTFYFCLALLFFTTFYSFLNSGCLVFPLAFSCSSNFSWSTDVNLIKDVNVWFELWSKAGASPNFVVSDRVDYIQNFNWVPNWIDNYFFNKMSDFICGLLFLITIMYLIFIQQPNNEKKIETNFLPIYFCLIILTIEWFLKHPTLRYGGYHLFALLAFIPISLILCKKKFDYKFFYKRCVILFIITGVIFIYRNLDRLINEYEKYSYNPIKELNYKFIGGNQNEYFRYNLFMRENIKNLDSKKIFNKQIYIISK